MNNHQPAVAHAERDDLGLREFILKKYFVDHGVSKGTCYLSFQYSEGTKKEARDPPDEFLERFAGMPYTVKKLSQYRPDAAKSTQYLPGAVYGVGIMEWLDDRTARVEYSMYGGVMFGAGYAATVELKDGQWAVRSSRQLWVE